MATRARQPPNVTWITNFRNPEDSLMSQIGGKIKLARILKATWPAHLGHQFDRDTVRQIDALVWLRVYGDLGQGGGAESKQKPLAVWREYRRVHDAAAEGHGFRVTGIEPWGAAGPMNSLECEPCQCDCQGHAEKANPVAATAPDCQGGERQSGGQRKGQFR